MPRRRAVAVLGCCLVLALPASDRVAPNPLAAGLDWRLVAASIGGRSSPIPDAKQQYIRIRADGEHMMHVCSGFRVRIHRFGPVVFLWHVDGQLALGCLGPVGVAQDAAASLLDELVPTLLTRRDGELRLVGPRGSLSFVVEPGPPSRPGALPIRDGLDEQLSVVADGAATWLVADVRAGRGQAWAERRLRVPAEPGRRILPLVVTGVAGRRLVAALAPRGAVRMKYRDGSRRPMVLDGGSSVGRWQLFHEELPAGGSGVLAAYDERGHTLARATVPDPPP
jgi:hypothetical protein